MPAEKRTVRSELKEFCAEIREWFRKWRWRKRLRTVSGAGYQSPDGPTLADQVITFTPLTVDKIDEDANPANERIRAASQRICPVTRQPLTADRPMYQCRECGMSYSLEGWEFLRKTAKGQCCGCRSANTVLPAVTEH